MKSTRRRMWAAATLVAAGLLGEAAVAQDRPYISEPTQTQSSMVPRVTAFETPLPVADEAAKAFLADRPGQVVYCTLMLVVDEYGKLDNAFGVGCPNALRASAIAAVQEWRFYPPTLGDRAVTGRQQVQFAFVSHSVVAPTQVDEEAILVRVAPTATPEWPAPPKPNGKAKRWMSAPPLCEGEEPVEGCVDEAVSLDGYRCLLDIEVAETGLLQNVLVVDCPGPLHQGVLRKLKRFGFTVQGAKPGDGTVYRYDAWIPND
ncbi:MAG: hypothetical protein H6741_20000 [Alphaproteobacteria bacterium]|nr:hypothetical protein [Alphaproteobacteria bacterium]